MKLTRRITSLALLVILVLTPIRSLAADGSTTVYTTKTGSKYHSSGCRHLSRSRYSTTLQNAVSSGLGPCGTCHPPVLSGSTSNSTPSVRSSASVGSAAGTQASTKTNTQTSPAQTPATFSPQLAVQQAYQHYLNGGLAPDVALARVQENTAPITTCKNSAEVLQFVQNDLQSLSATTTPVSGTPTPEQVVQQAFNALVAGGMSPNDALAHVQANLTAILSQSGQ